jgi:hypothetical protein
VQVPGLTKRFQSRIRTQSISGYGTGPRPRTYSFGLPTPLSAQPHRPSPLRPPRSDDRPQPPLSARGDECTFEALALVEQSDDERYMQTLLADKKLTLSSLEDVPPDCPPPQPMFFLCALAINGSLDQRLTKQGIHIALMSRFQWFWEHPNDSWRTAVKDSLNGTSIFSRAPPLATQSRLETCWKLNIYDKVNHELTRKRTVVPDLTAGSSSASKRVSKLGRQISLSSAKPSLHYSLQASVPTPQLHSPTSQSSTPVSSPSNPLTTNELESLVARLATITFQDHIVYPRSFSDRWRSSAEEVLSAFHGFRPTDAASRDMARRMIDQLDEVGYPALHSDKHKQLNSRCENSRYLGLLFHLHRQSERLQSRTSFIGSAHSAGELNTSPHLASSTKDLLWRTIGARLAGTPMSTGVNIVVPPLWSKQYEYTQMNAQRYAR